MNKVSLQYTVANLDHDLVIEALSRNAVNVTDTAHELNVPVSDLRRLMWATPRLQDEAFEMVEARLDLSEKKVFEALNSEDARRADAAAYFCLRNTASARKRGWITSASAGVDVNINANRPPQRIIVSWLTDDDPDDNPNGDEAAAGPLIEHESAPPQKGEKPIDRDPER